MINTSTSSKAKKNGASATIQKKISIGSSSPLPQLGVHATLNEARWPT
jgi:hypothetical protein